MPKRRTTEDKYGEPVLKKRRDEGKKWATCTGCGHQFLSAKKVPAKSRSGFINSEGFIACAGCGQNKAKYD